MSKVKSSFSVQIDNAVLHQQLQKMYDVDFVTKNERFGYEVSVDDRKALAAMEKSVSRVEGHYQIAHPWKSDNLKLPDNKFVSVRRLACPRKRLKTDAHLLKNHQEKMNEYIKLDYARKIPKEEIERSSRTWYLPHHATGPKFRVVFDCAATCKGTSLNDQLLKGPDQTNTLIGVLLSFRCGRPGRH